MIFVLLRVQNQVSNVIGIMKDNISRVMDRGEKLDALEEKSGKLHVHCMSACSCRTLLQCLSPHTPYPTKKPCMKSFPFLVTLTITITILMRVPNTLHVHMTSSAWLLAHITLLAVSSSHTLAQCAHFVESENE